MNRKRVGILIFNDVEVLDFCGPFEVFSVTRLNREDPNEDSPFEVVIVAETLDPVVTRGGMKVIPQHTLDSCPTLDILVVPGGLGTRVQRLNTRLVGWIGERARQVETLTSVCTGSLLLGQAGLLDGRRATTHFAALDLMRKLFPAIKVEADLHVVEEGNVLTSAGISAGIEMALRVVERYHGAPVARDTARFMEYRYSTDNSRRV